MPIRRMTIEEMRDERKKEEALVKEFTNRILQAEVPLSETKRIFQEVCSFLEGRCTFKASPDLADYLKS